MSLSLLHAPPETIAAAAGQSAGTTPASFEGVAPVLRWYAPRAEVRLSSLPSALEGATFTPQGRAVHALGQVWVTDAALSFLPEQPEDGDGDGGVVGFSVAHGGITLHALTRSLPAQLKRKTDTALYLHLDDSPEQDDDGEDGGSLTELWVVLPPDTEHDSPTLQAAFDAVSYAATLVPSTGASGADNPLAAFGPFGTGCMAGGPCGIVDDDPLSPDSDEQASRNGPGKPELDEHVRGVRTPPPRQASVGDTPDTGSTVLIFSGLPPEFFMHPHLATALLDLLNAYGPLRRYVPLVPHGRAIVVYEASDAAARAKAKLDHLPLPSPRGTEQIRVYFGQRGDELVWAPLDDEDAHLHVPRLEKNFIISPPGSPPVGWQPSMDPAPKKQHDDLADDLVAALTQLTQPPGSRCGTHGASDQEISPGAAAATQAEPAAAQHLPSGPQVVLLPDAGMPGVSLDLVPDDTPREGPTIAEVKAAYAAHATPAPPIAEPTPGSGTDLDSGAIARIQPTARPPLETMYD